MERERLNPETLRKVRREIEKDERRKREVAEELRRGFRGYVEQHFDLTERQRAELDRTPKELHELCGYASAIGLEKGWEIELVPEQGSSNLRVEVYCNVGGECGVRVSGDC